MEIPAEIVDLSESHTRMEKSSYEVVPEGAVPTEPNPCEEEGVGVTCLCSKPKEGFIPPDRQTSYIPDPVDDERADPAALISIIRISI